MLSKNLSSFIAVSLATTFMTGCDSRSADEPMKAPGSEELTWEKRPDGSYVHISLSETSEKKIDGIGLKCWRNSQKFRCLEIAGTEDENFIVKVNWFQKLPRNFITAEDNPDYMRQEISYSCASFNHGDLRSEQISFRNKLIKENNWSIIRENFLDTSDAWGRPYVKSFIAEESEDRFDVSFWCNSLLDKLHEGGFQILLTSIPNDSILD